jgi:hypothetical protein
MTERRVSECMVFLPSCYAILFGYEMRAFMIAGRAGKKKLV